MPLIIPANTLTGGYEVANSCRFNDDDSAEMHKTPGGAGNQDVWTFSCWVKRGRIGTGNTQTLYGVYADSSNQEILAFNSGGSIDTIYWQMHQGGAKVGELQTNRLFRDSSAWYNIVISYNSAASATLRMRMWINGTEETSFSSDVNPTSGLNSQWNGTTKHQIGCQNTQSYLDGYLAEVVSLDGTAVTDATNFGEFDEDSPTIWKPIDVSGLTFGTNGFYCDFEDSANLGNDANGGTDLTEVNLAATDQATDTPTNNFATFIPLDKLTTGAPAGSEGNLELTGDASTNNTWNSSIGLSSGKWYYEIKMLASNPDASLAFRSQVNTSGSHNNSYGFDANSDKKLINGASSGSAVGSTSQNDILGMALDLDNGKMWIHRAGTYLSSGDPAGDANPFIETSDGLPTEGVIGGHIYNGVVQLNFGNPVHSIASGNADANGYGNFEYAVPSGFYALCTKNLAEYG